MISRRPIAIWLILVLFSWTGCSPQSASRTATPSASSSLPQITDASFQSEVLESTKPVLVEVGVDYACFRCETMKPRVADVARQFAGQVRVVRVDFRAEAALARRLGVVVCPTYLVVHEGQVVDSIVGETPTPMLSAKLAAVVDRGNAQR